MKELEKLQVRRIEKDFDRKERKALRAAGCALARLKSLRAQRENFAQRYHLPRGGHEQQSV